MDGYQMELGNSSQASDQYPPSSPTISTSTVLGMPGQLNLDSVSASADTEEGEFDRRCERLINGVLGGNDRTVVDVLTALMAFADLSPGVAPLDVSAKSEDIAISTGDCARCGRGGCGRSDARG